MWPPDSARYLFSRRAERDLLDLRLGDRPKSWTEKPPTADLRHGQNNEERGETEAMAWHHLRIFPLEGMPSSVARRCSSFPRKSFLQLALHCDRKILLGIALAP